jgi:hypothetical protein
MTCGLHLNSRGKRSVIDLIAERVSGEHVSSISSIPVTISQQKCKLTIQFNQYISSEYLTNKEKSDELIYSSEIDVINPHVLCLSKHHMVEQDLLHLT